MLHSFITVQKVLDYLDCMEEFIITEKIQWAGVGVCVYLL